MTHTPTDLPQSVQPAPPGKWRSIALLVVVEIIVLAVWFMSAAILPEMRAEAALSPGRAAALSSAVQIGFVVGALVIAITGIADRFDPRRVLMLSALGAAGANALLVAAPIGGVEQMALRFLTGASLAGVYPTGMKIAVGWGTKDRGFLVGLLIGALTVGSASPHLIALLGGSEWRATVLAGSVLAALGGIIALGVGLGPHHGKTAVFDARALGVAWTNRRARLAIAGYLGHMWELYSFWAWVGAAAAASFVASGWEGDADRAGRFIAFLAISLGGLACAPAGKLADRIGKARVAQWCMIASGTAGLLSAWSFGGPVWLTAALLIVWGVMVIPDSAQFSALVADAVPPQIAGSVMTLQTALGFVLTAVTVQATPLAAASFGWPATLAVMAIGPALGVEAMRRLIAMGPHTQA